jgi:integrase
MATIEKYQLKSGATLYAVRYRKPDNKQTMKRGFPTKRDAQEFANSVEVKKLRGEYIAPTVGKTTIAELGPRWLERQRGHLKISVLMNYQTAWRIHVEPRWAHKRIAEIQYTEVQAWVSDMKTHLSTSSVVRIYTVLAKILDDCVRDGMLVKNPARGVRLPKRPPTHNTYLTRPQLRLLADECGEYRSLVLLLGTGGLRWSEAAALRVSDIDVPQRRIRLHTSVTRTPDGPAAGTLKSNRNRVVVLPQFVIDALAQTCEGKQHGDLMWPSETRSYLSSPSSSGSWLSRAVRRCQEKDPTFPRVTAHALRHTAASLAIQARANPKVVQRMLGHASAAMTLDVYADLFETDLVTVADRIADMWVEDEKSDDANDPAPEQD